VAQRDLRRVQRLAGRLEEARVALRDAILAAHESGESVRDIAPYAGMSPSRVHELLVEAREAADADDL
jgi:DNA-directed RNA polymerase specialized sigma24 family protein